LHLLDLVPGVDQRLLESPELGLGLVRSERSIGNFGSSLADSKDAGMDHPARECDTAVNPFPGWLSFRHAGGLRNGVGEGNGFSGRMKPDGDPTLPPADPDVQPGSLRKFARSWRPFSVRMLSGWN